MRELALLPLVLLPCAAAGLATLRALGALPARAGDRQLAGLAVGLGIAATAGLGLAAIGHLRLLAIVGLALAALAAGGGLVARDVAALDLRGIRRAWPLLVVCGAVLVLQLGPMLAPPIGGDQTKYHLAYPRLYAERGALLATPWAIWGQMQFLPNFLYAVGFTVSGGSDVLPRLLNGTFGVLAALALVALVRRHLAPGLAAIVGALFFTLPFTWSAMTRAGADLAVILYATLAVTALLDWVADEEPGALRRAALAAGLAGGCKILGLLVPALVGTTVLVTLARRARPLGRVAASAVSFGLIALVAAGPCYLRTTLDTGNPLFPFGYSVFGGRNWSAASADYLGDYYEDYQTTHATKREGNPYTGLAVLRFPWDLTMHPQSFENAARQALDIGPFVLAFAPALLLVRRRRNATLLVGGLGLAYLAITAGAAWAHPRYVIPGIALLLAASVPAARELLGRRVFLAAVAFTILGHLALTSRLLQPLWADQTRVALGRLGAADFLRSHSPRYAFWERANGLVPEKGLVMVLEKVPHPYYIQRPFILASYLEQDMIDYRTITSPEALADVARDLGVTHVAVFLDGLEASGDPFETAVAGLWRGFVASECDLVVRESGYGLYVLRGPTAFASRAEGARG